ncbi:MAG TPA: VTT domain-containing protein, partial [Candidatus Polarisedimenticolia bacterium]|nr:VTT domain-containing protein [Candidatus Polarisedimenticolia bacterium]
APAPAADLWPADAEPDLTNADVAIARTFPEFESRPAVRECETLLLDAIGAARRSLYIESQYFTSEKLADAVAARLREPDGPEVLVVVPRECEGWLERNTMGAFREGVFRRMAAANAHGRLRLLYPMASRAREIPTFIHSKVLVADDVLLRIGSANLARRSMGLDTECDLAVDGSGDSGARAGIRLVRDRLLGEHLGLTAEEVAAEVARAGSLRQLVDGRAGEDRTLVRIDPATLEEPSLPDAVKAAADPDGPVALDTVLEAVPQVRGSRLAGAGVSALAFVALFPVGLLATAAGLLLGAVLGIPVAFAGALLLAAIGHAAGRLLGGVGLARWMTRRAYRSARQLGAKGVRGVLSLRLASIANGGSVHLFCGARRIPFGPYLLGSALALAPQVVALAGLGALLRQAALQPSAARGVMVLATVLLLLVVSVLLRSALLTRRYAPSLERHRNQAEFG